MENLEVLTVHPKKRGRPGGFVGSSNRDIKYECSQCGVDVGKGNVFSKRVTFATIGKPSKAIRTRTTQWLCEPCMHLDPDFNRDQFTDSPGMRDVHVSTDTQAITP